LCGELRVRGLESPPGGLRAPLHANAAAKTIVKNQVVTAVCSWAGFKRSSDGTKLGCVHKSSLDSIFFVCLFDKIDCHAVVLIVSPALGRAGAARCRSMPRNSDRSGKV